MNKDNKGRYARSEAMLARAERVIPLGSQTFSKSRIQLPKGAAPYFLERGDGGRVWDVDGNEYVDLVCALLPVVLGYRDRDVDKAVKTQLDRGISFSLATELEIELAERLVEIIPCAEMVRFGKNGSDATSGAVRIARAATGRERIATCGYHGWQDWYIGSTVRSKGIPDAVGRLTHPFPYNDPGALHGLFKEHSGEFAAVIMEPMHTHEPKEGFLQEVRQLAHRNGALFILDEIITGFRFALGGAQSLFSVTPDLACFGKSMGNGMPIAAVVGKAEYMKEMEEIFFSFTFGGEALSLAASIAVIDKMRREPVIETLWERGRTLVDSIREKIRMNGLESTIQLQGFPPWTIIEIRNHVKASSQAIQTFFVREMFREGILVKGSHNLCYAHSPEDLEAVEAAYDDVLPRIAEQLACGGLSRIPDEDLIRPVFSVR